MMHIVFLGLGTNLGSRKVNMERSISLIEEKVGRVISRSSLYETKAWGLKEQPDFLNQVLKIQTLLSPEAMLRAILAIETAMGRVRVQKWYSRVIDIDILLYEDRVINKPDLIIPHPYLQERNFVLAPLVEIAPHLVHPVFKKTMAALYEVCTDLLAIEKVK